MELIKSDTSASCARRWRDISCKADSAQGAQNQACEPPKGMGDWWRGVLRVGVGWGGEGGLAGSEAQTEKQVSQFRK